MKKIIIIVLVGLFTLTVNQSFAQSKKTPTKKSLRQTKRATSKKGILPIKSRKNSKKQKVDKVQMRKNTTARRKKTKSKKRN